MFGVRPPCLHLCLAVSFRQHITEHDVDGGVCVCVCLSGFVVSVVNGGLILITAGTSWSHVPGPLQITRVKHLTLCVLGGRGGPTYLGP